MSILDALYTTCWILFLVAISGMYLMFVVAANETIESAFCEGKFDTIECHERNEVDK